MRYSKKFDWQPVDEQKGWEKDDLRDNLHRIKVREQETDQENTQWFNFKVSQTQNDSWKRHVDQWIEKKLEIKDLSKNGVLK